MASVFDPAGLYFFLIDQAVPLLWSLFGGLRRFLLGRFGAYRYFPKESTTMLGVTPLSICTLTASGVKTNYCHPDDAENMAWLVSNDAERQEGGYDISRFVVLKECVRVMWHWFFVSISGAKERDWAVASIITLRWIIGLQWVTLWMLGRKVRGILQSARYKKVFCVHEMWPWSRMVWSVARCSHVQTITIQHASIVRNKLWYFPTEAERDAGLLLPNAFAVFSQKESRLLSSFYPNTQFYFGCGPRYAHWKAIAHDSPVRELTSPRFLLFATSIPWWDNEVVFQGAEKLRASGALLPIRVRPHPFAVISRPWKRWLSRVTGDARSGVTFSHNSLHEDIRNAAVVIGMNTTVLEEAAAMGRPVIVLTTERYLSFVPTLGAHVTLDTLKSTLVKNIIQEYSTAQQEYRAYGRESLALDQPIFRMT